MARPEKPMLYYSGPTNIVGFVGCIAARSKAEVRRLGEEAFGDFTLSFLNEEWDASWSQTASSILGDQNDPGVWIRREFGSGPFFRMVPIVRGGERKKA